jgi:hypothetical protein
MRNTPAAHGIHRHTPTAPAVPNRLGRRKKMAERAEGPPQRLKTLDFAKPIALILSGVMGHVTDTGEARSIVRNLMGTLPSGSFLSLDDGTSIVGGEQLEHATQDYNETGAIPYVQRAPGEIASFFDGLELVEPGVVSCPRWRPKIRQAIRLPRWTRSAGLAGSPRGQPFTRRSGFGRAGAGKAARRPHHCSLAGCRCLFQ